jgi:hypothetical protein
MQFMQQSEKVQKNIFRYEVIIVRYAEHITLRILLIICRKANELQKRGIKKQKKIIKIMWGKIMTCSECQWYVEENTRSGRYEHEEALKQGRGFCLIQDLFTDKEPFEEACEDFKNDGK